MTGEPKVMMRRNTDLTLKLDEARPDAAAVLLAGFLAKARIIDVFEPLCGACATDGGGLGWYRDRADDL